MKIKDLPSDERPRERLVSFGAGALSNAELIAIILGSGNSKENILDLSKRLLKKNDLRSLSQLSVSELRKNFGIGEAKACQIVACFELGRRFASDKNGNRKRIKTSIDAANLLFAELRDLKREVFKGIYLDAKNKVLREETIFTGSLDMNVIHPREIFKIAIAESAAGIIIAHNHPSGDPSPSKEDIELTLRLKEAGKIIGIDILDHLIIGDWWISLKEEGMI
jgi:DNA repair protein RadC